MLAFSFHLFSFGCVLCLNSKLSAGGFDYIIREVYQELGQAALSRGIIAQDRREGGVPEGLGEALAECLARSRVVAESVPIN